MPYRLDTVVLITTGDSGPHTTGKAADILVSGGDALVLLSMILDAGIKRIGVMQKGLIKDRFIHLDISQDHPSPAAWSY